jgi:hypothetical protein
MPLYSKWCKVHRSENKRKRLWKFTEKANSRRPAGDSEIFQREACQVLPLTRLGTRAQAPDAPVDLFRDWQEHTNSILLGSQTSCACQWMSGSIHE